MTEIDLSSAGASVFSFNPRMGIVYVKPARGGHEEQPFLTIRGWGYLTGRGHGALDLDPKEAAAIQDRNGQIICDLLNGSVGHTVKIHREPLFARGPYRAIEPMRKIFGVSTKDGDLCPLVDMEVASKEVRDRVAKILNDYHTFLTT